MAEVTCIEKRADTARNEQIIRSDYNIDNQYSANHQDAKGDGDKRGKGSDSPGHGDWKLNCDAPANVFDFYNFDTSFENNLGNDVDNEARNKAMLKSLYSPTHPYGDVEFMGHEGQYFVP